MRPLRLLVSTVLLCSSLPLAAQAPENPDPKQRIRAARDLARQGSGAIAKLQPMLSDPVAEVRIEAVKAIVEIGTGAVSTLSSRPPAIATPK